MTTRQTDREEGRDTHVTFFTMTDEAGESHSKTKKHDDLLPGGRVIIVGRDAPLDVQGSQGVLVEPHESPRGTRSLWRLRLADGSGRVISLPAADLERTLLAASSSRRTGKSNPPGPPAEAQPSGEPKASTNSENSESGVSRGTSKASNSGGFIRAHSGSSLDHDHHGVDRCRRRARRMLENKAFDAFVAVIILLNFALTVLDTDAGAVGASAPPWIYWLMVVCFMCILLEFATRFYVDRCEIFLSPWGWLDVVIIAFGFLEYAIQSSNWGGTRILRVFRIFRLFRLARIVLQLKVFSELAKLVQMMGSCFRTLFWSFLLMGFFMTVWAIIAVEVVHPYVKELVDEKGLWADCERCRRSFSSVFHADITLFQTIVAGDSWGQVAIPIIEHKPWTAIVFMGALLTLIFGVLNLVVAVVVDAAAEFRAKDISSRGHTMEYEEIQEKKKLTKLFSKIDVDGSGSVSFEELMEGARKVPEFRHWLRVLDIDSSDLLQLFQMADEDASGEIDMEEFVDAMYRFKNTESKTAVRFVKHLVTKMQKHQMSLDEKLHKLGERAFRRSIRRSGNSSRSSTIAAVRETMQEEEEARELVHRTDAILEEKLSHQMKLMEAAFQQATQEALEIAVRTAADTTRRLLCSASAADLEEQRRGLGRQLGQEFRGTGCSSGDRNYWPVSWWQESMLCAAPPRPSQGSVVEILPIWDEWEERVADVGTLRSARGPAQGDRGAPVEEEAEQEAGEVARESRSPAAARGREERRPEPRTPRREPSIEAEQGETLGSASEPARRDSGVEGRPGSESWRLVLV